MLAPIVGQDPVEVYPKLQWTQELKKGDLALAVPALQIKGTKPQELAAKIGEQFHETDLVEKPVVNGIYIQFYFKPPPLTNRVLSAILKEKAGYGTNPNLGLRDPHDSSKRKKIIVEFSSPNIAKPFHAGHLRSTIIGGFIANLYQTIGWEVYKMNYLGEYHLHMFWPFSC
jgi:arginyl-tRNA synthetase